MPQSLAAPPRSPRARTYLPFLHACLAYHAIVSDALWSQLTMPQFPFNYSVPFRHNPTPPLHAPTQFLFNYAIPGLRIVYPPPITLVPIQLRLRGRRSVHPGCLSANQP